MTQLGYNTELITKLTQTLTQEFVLIHDTALAPRQTLVAQWHLRAYQWSPLKLEYITVQIFCSVRELLKLCVILSIVSTQKYNNENTDTTTGEESTRIMIRIV